MMDRACVHQVVSSCLYDCGIDPVSPIAEVDLIFLYSCIEDALDIVIPEDLPCSPLDVECFVNRIYEACF